MGRTEDYYVNNYAEGSFGTSVKDWQERINVHQMRSDRLAKANTALAAHDLCGILSINEYNTRYITGTNTAAWTRENSGLRYSLLPTGGKPFIFEQGDIGYHTDRNVPWLEGRVDSAITGAGWTGLIMGPAAQEIQTKKMASQIKSQLVADGVDFSLPLGIDHWDITIIAALEAEGIKIASAWPAMYDARECKTEDEVECLRIGCAIGEGMFQKLKESIKPGVRETEMMGVMVGEGYRLGANWCGGSFAASGPMTWPNIRHFGDRIVRPGDIVYADVYKTAFLEYKICYYRTFSCGKPHQATVDCYNEAVDWLYDSIDVIRAGITTADIADKWPSSAKVWADIGIDNEDKSAGNNWAHGIGLSLYERPLVWRAVSLDSPMPIKENMTFAIETQNGDGRGQGVRIEEMLRVTKTGCEMLSRWPIEEITVCES
jgi:Xaa-Pro aminopeptidase